MPHIIVEYSNNIEGQVDVPALLVKIHNALASEGVDKARIKTRGVALSHSVVGGAELDVGQMAHITLLLLEGRDIKTKQQYANAIHSAAKTAVLTDFPNCAVTMEVRDMVTETYIL